MRVAAWMPVWRMLGSGGNAAWELPIPNQIGLVGLHFYNQALVFDPGTNALGAVISDAAEAVVGR